MDTDIHWLGACELGRRIHAGELTSLEATDAQLRRIETLDPDLHAFATVLGDQARAAAGRSDEELRTGRSRGPLHGVPIAVKELCAVRGVATGAGTRVLRDRIAERDACVVERLRNSGAVILGTTAMTEGAYAEHHPDIEPPRNPWARDRWPGISSSGSGVATASGLCFASNGTDTGGSIRMPSAANGLVGIKPTYGRVPRHGIFPLSDSLDHVGPIARTVTDAAAMLTAMAGHDPRDPTSLTDEVPDIPTSLDSGVRGLRIGIDEEFACEAMDAEIVDPILQCRRVFEEAGARIVPVRLPPWREAVFSWAPICAAECALAHEGLFPEHAQDYGEQLSRLIEAGRMLSGVELARSMQVRAAFCGGLAELFTTVDLLLCPSLGVALPPAVPDFDDPLLATRLTRFTAPFNLSGSPTISLPCDFDKDGLPLSLQLVARHLEESTLCRAGRQFERITEWHHHPNV